MPVESTTNNQGRQIVVLIEKVDTLTSYIKSLTEKIDGITTNLVVFQKDYYVEHQKVIGDVSRHEQILSDIKSDVLTIERCADELRLKTVPIDDISTLKKAVYGNGGIGLIGKVEKLQDWVANQVWFQRLIIGAIVSQIVVLIILLLRATPVQ
jgi:hypothetical protein